MRSSYCYGAGNISVINTVNVDIFAQYIFSRIWCRVLDARKYDVSEKINCYSLIELTGRCAEICT